MKRALLLSVTLVVAAASPARATPAPAEPRPISGTSPLPPDCAPTERAYLGAEVEPMVAVNPANHDNIIATWQQDRYFDGGARADLVAFTRDGGATWRAVVVPGLYRCAGGPLPRATDPWISIGPDGRAYFLAESFSGQLPGSFFYGPAAIAVSTSIDGGETWGAPVPIVADPGVLFSDKATITADPYQAGRAYAAWLRSPGNLGSFSRTDDGGQTWLPPVPVPLRGQGHLIVVLPDRTLVMVAKNGASIEAIRSTDGGLTWSTPISVGEARAENPNDARIRDFNLPSVAVGPDGAVYVTWAENLGIVLAKSDDGGQTWTPARVSSDEVLAFCPTVAVTTDGVVAVMFYDLRNDAAGGAIVTDVWLASSVGGTAPWTERHLSGPFDMRNAPDSYTGGYFVGDYQGIGVAGSLLVPVFVRPTTTTGVATDVFAAVVDP